MANVLMENNTAALGGLCTRP